VLVGGLVGRAIRLTFLYFSCVFLGLVTAQEQRSAADYVKNGNSYMQRSEPGDCAFAQYSFQEALRLEPGNLEAKLGKGRSLSCQGALALAIEEFQGILALDANNISAQVLLAEAYQKQWLSDTTRYPEGLPQSMQLLAQAEAIDPNNPTVWNAKGVGLYYQKDLEGARVSLEKATSLSTTSEAVNDRDRSKIHENLGSVYRSLGQFDQALQAFRRAVTYNPLSASAHNNVGDTYFKLGLDNCDNAIYELSQASKLNPQFLDASANLAISLFDCGNIDASIPKFEQALDMPGSLNLPPLYTYLSRAYVQKGNFDEAVKRAQQGALLPPVSADALFYLGQAYEARNGSGDMQRAKEAYQSALETSPSYTAAQDALARLP
jgi:tetratricopeptide (TPR) repeat protein